MRLERELIENSGTVIAANDADALRYNAHDEDKHYSKRSGGGFLAARNQDSILSAFDLLVTSGCAKMCALLLTYPHEVLRSRMMDLRAMLAPTLIGTFCSIVTLEGFAGVYLGLPVALLRVVPNCCITFVSYEYLLQYSWNWFVTVKEKGGK